MPDWAQLEPFLNARLLGQREAVAEFASAVIRAESGPARPNRTRAFILLLGPTGTGKTELVNLAAEFIHGREAKTRLARFDMGEYQHPDSVKRLLGAPDQPPLLGRAIDQLNDAGGGILLLDEIEKAFPDLVTALLSFDSGRSTMYDGTTRDLSGLTVVLTSNLGAAEATRMENNGYSAICRKLRHAAEERFRKEGVARFTAVISTRALDYFTQQEITRLALARELAIQAVHLQRVIEADPDSVTFLLSKGFSRDLGARNIRNCVERYVGEALRPSRVEAGPPGPVDAMADRWSDGLTITPAGEALVAVPMVNRPALRPTTAGGRRTEAGGTVRPRGPSEGRDNFCLNHHHYGHSVEISPAREIAR